MNAVRTGAAGSESYTKKLNRHEVVSYGALPVSTCCGASERGDYTAYRGEDPVAHFLEMMMDKAAEHQKVVQSHKQLVMTLADEQRYGGETQCHVCQKTVDKDNERCRDHCHM